MLESIILTLIGSCCVGAMIAFPTWRYSRYWGYGPAVSLGCSILILLLFLLLSKALQS